MCSLMADVVHLVGVGEDAPCGIANDGVILPGALPQLVEHLQVLVGVVVAGIVRGLVGLSHIARRGGQIPRDHVPSDPASGEVIEGG